jgi:hypothetical protein
VARRRGRERIALLVAIATAVAIASPSAAGAAGSPFDMRWRAQGEVGGDRGGRSTQTVLADSMRLESVAGGYRGSVKYSDRVVIQDVKGDILVQVSKLALNLVGAPASGGAALAGSFDGTAQLDTYAAASFADAQAGRLPARPSSSVTYSVLGHWGARLAGSVAVGEVVFGSATPRASSGKAVERDVGWFMRSDQGTQQFRVEVQGAAATPEGTGIGDDGAGGGGSSGRTAARASILTYVLRGFAGAPRTVAPVPAESAATARTLRDARPIGATPLPANAVTMDLDVAGHTLDAKNRAAGLDSRTSAGAPTRSTWASAVAASASATRSPGAETTLLDVMLSPIDIPGARARRAGRRPAPAPAPQSPIVTGAKIREWYLVTLALQQPPPASVLGGVAEASVAVRDSRVKVGPLSDALLAAADAFDAPPSARDVRSFTREPAKDTPGPAGAGVVGEVLSAAPRGAAGTPVVSWASSTPRTVEPETWLAYARADSTVFWLAGPDGPVALTDGTLDGWGFTARRAYLVDAARVGRLLAVLPAPPAAE